MKALIINLFLFVFFSLLLVSCNGTAYNEAETVEEMEEATEAMEEATENMEEIVVDSIDAEQRQELYCCTNHTPRHCGNEEAIDKLAASGCTGFE